MALNSFRKHCFNVLSTALHFFAIKTYDYGQDFCFYHKMKQKAGDKTLEQCLMNFCFEFLQELKNGLRSYIKHLKEWFN